MLDYTSRADRQMRAFEQEAGRDSTADVFTLVGEGKISPDSGIWYQAVQGYWFLCGAFAQRLTVADELQRYLFLHRMGGICEGESFILPDGTRAGALTEELLFSKMTACLRDSFLSCRIASDYGISEKVPHTPSAIARLLREGTDDRNVLLRAVFSLKPDLETFNRLLSAGGQFRGLSPAVPRDLILMYCIENGNFNWNFVNDLQAHAQELRDEAEANRRGYPAFYLRTTYAEEAWGSCLRGLGLDEFVSSRLLPCCQAATGKEIHSVKHAAQYSRRALKILRHNTVLEDLGSGRGNCAIGPRVSVFVTDQVNRYAHALSLEQDYLQPLPVGRMLSIEQYCRFLSYRMMQPGTRNSYCLQFSPLPGQLCESIMKHHHIFHLRSAEEGAKAVRPHRIWRHMILLTTFLRLLMEKWDREPVFYTTNRAAALELWRTYFTGVNGLLQDCGYPTISQKNPLDAMLRICTRSLSPLECYNRIYELAILEGMTLDPEGYSPERYPPVDRITRVVEQLQTSAAQMPDETYREQCAALCGRIRHCIARYQNPLS